MKTMTLGTALAIFGGVVLALLALQLWWGTRRRQRRMQLDSESQLERTEPAMGGDGGPAGAALPAAAVQSRRQRPFRSPGGEDSAPRHRRANWNASSYR